ncbi:hypothetical protein T01_13779 [Trichinella spiralis]|uniref:Uncharacterized protein n=1 Tax=Trichinella spiralis TaxID=6334 RepID=A0A0V1BV79_TRISP|nr:hypothetical protein T01_13779 [Trichinella spiralis]
MWVEETMRSLIQMVCLAAYATRHGSTTDSGGEAGVRDTEILGRVEVAFARHMLDKKQWELNYDHDVCVADSPLTLYQWFSTRGARPPKGTWEGSRGERENSVYWFHSHQRTFVKRDSQHLWHFIRSYNVPHHPLPQEYTTSSQIALSELRTTALYKGAGRRQSAL